MSTMTISHDESTPTFGFWVYVMTDCVLFASLFATYAVLHNNISGGPAGRDLFDLSFVLKETFILLTSSFTCGLAMVSANRQNKFQTLLWFTLTAVLGLTFLGMELTEFSHLIQDGHSWRQSAFLSSYFTLVGTHGLHIAVGLLWSVVLILQVVKKGFAPSTMARLTLLSLFWHFLDIIWIFIFTLVYLLGVQ